MFPCSHVYPRLLVEPSGVWAGASHVQAAVLPSLSSSRAQEARPGRNMRMMTLDGICWILGSDNICVHI